MASFQGGGPDNSRQRLLLERQREQLQKDMLAKRQLLAQQHAHISPTKFVGGTADIIIPSVHAGGLGATPTTALPGSTLGSAATPVTTDPLTVTSLLGKRTMGLLELEEYRKIKEDVEAQRQRQVVALQVAADKDAKKKALEKKKKRKMAGAARAMALSFDMPAEEEEEGEKQEKECSEDATDVKIQGDGEQEPQQKGDGERNQIWMAPKKRGKWGKDPTVDTSFLPDKEREEMERVERERLRKEWLEIQEKTKQEVVEITFSYWDGSGHRKTVECKKGDTIFQFLEKAKNEFPELRKIPSDNLMYIKEDLIIPNDYTFYTLIVNRARGKSGPLFSFDVHDDVRLINDARKEKDESHAGKVVERHWYDRNKHIFPANRWEVYDPKKDYGSYSIKDKLLKK